MTFDAETSLRLIAESLSLVDRLGADPIHARGVRMADRTLLVEIIASSADPVAVRGEIAGAMGALSGLDVPGLFPALQVQAFGVRAFDAAGAELLWIVSSIEAAAFAGKGQPIEWLARSLVQENTPAYRRSQADRTIGQIETALRDLLDLHAREHVGDDYLHVLWSASDLKGLGERARAEGLGTDDARGLLDFSYLPQLRDILVAHAEWMADGCVADARTFGDALTQLNGVRRKVAHHRPISEDDLLSCRNAAQSLLVPIGRAHPDLADDFLVDRWEEQIAEIVAAAMQSVQSPTVPERGTVPERNRLAAAALALETQLTGIELALARLGQLVVPAQRSELHDRVVAALTGWRDGLRRLVAAARRPGLTVEAAQAAHSDYEKALGEVGELRREIQRLRVGMPEHAQ